MRRSQWRLSVMVLCLVAAMALVTGGHPAQGVTMPELSIRTASVHANPCPENAGFGGQGDNSHVTVSADPGVTQAGHGCVVIMYGSTTVAYTATGSATWTVPTGVTEVTVHLIGAGGGGSSTGQHPSGAHFGGGNHPGGGGGYVTGVLAVSAGSTYDVTVGAGGRRQCVDDRVADPTDLDARRNSSFGGGAAGHGVVTHDCSWASGGGRSAIGLGSEEIATAGGGGGGGYSGVGGAGGGENGGDGSRVGDAALAGKGGTETVGGAGGGPGEPGYDGVQFLGGPAGVTWSANSEGGGGGGGWYGGGGGGDNGGGGGGSSRIAGLAQGCTIAGNSPTTGAVPSSALTVPNVSGAPAINGQLTAYSGTWTCHSSRSFQWQLSSDGTSWQDVPGAIGPTFSPTVSGQVRVQETAVNLFGSGVTTSAATVIPDTSLTGLTVSAGTLAPAFSPSVFAYTVTVPFSVTTMALTPTWTVAGLEVTVGAEPATSATASSPVTLPVGDTEITLVAATAGASTTTSVTVSRLPAPSVDSVPPASPPPTTTPAPPPAPAPVREPQGALPQLAPGVASLIVDDQVIPLTVSVEEGTELLVRLGDDTFGLGVRALCAGAACPIDTFDGRPTVRATPEGMVTVRGYGFLPGSQVEVWVFSTPRFLGTVTVAADGTFRGTLTLGDLAVGVHTLQANGLRADGIAQSVNLGILVAPTDTTETTDGQLPQTGGDPSRPLSLVLVLLCGGVFLVLSGRGGGRPAGSPHH